jgi:hypothetical protein
MSSLEDLLDEILQNMTLKELAVKLNIATGTIKRWKDKNSVPTSYKFEFMKILNMNIDYSLYSYKDKDQFFTPCETATYCHNRLKEILNIYDDNEANYNYIEPAAGDGKFMDILPRDRTIGLDIEPKSEGIIQADYLDWYPQPSQGSNIVIGNPPFGLRGQLALKFINHSYEFADYVCFILPQLFASDGKGNTRNRVKGYKLLHSENIDTDFTDPDGKSICVNCILQIWSKYHSNPQYDIQETNHDVLNIYSLSDGGTPSNTRNKNMLDKCHIYLPSTCFGVENMRPYNSFEELPNKRGYGIVFNRNVAENIEKFKNINWTDVAFLSTNNAYNMRMSKISSLFQA